MILFSIFVYFLLHSGTLGAAEEDDYQRHIIEAGVKSALFGSNSYDPIRKTFDSIDDSKKGPTTGEGSTLAGADDDATISRRSEQGNSRKMMANGQTKSASDWWSKFKALRNVDQTEKKREEKVEGETNFL